MIDKRGKKGETEASRGFTLIGVLVSMALLALLAGGTLQSAVQLRNHFEMVTLQRNAVLEKWNESRRLRHRRTPSASLQVTLPGARPLYSHRLENDGIGWSWEVWVGEY